jgi:hypothetical protein
MMAAAALVVVLAGVGAAQADTDRAIVAGGIGVRVTGDWARVPAADTGSETDPRTLLVVGTRGVAPRTTSCQVSSYRIPADGAAVVVIGWRGIAPDGLPRDRSELLEMRLKRPMFECFDGRGAVAQIVVKGRAYQVNVLVGDRATRDAVAGALAVARSFAAVS